MKSWATYTGAFVAAMLVWGESSSGAAQSASYLDQGWSTADRNYFYRTTQGSRLMSYRVFINLERPGSTLRFAAPDNLGAMGYVFDPNNTSNDGLPIGFVKDTVSNKPDAIGLTCSACHTRDISVKNTITGAATRFRIDGSQGAPDTERFLHELEAALRATSTDTAKFARLCTATGSSTSAAQTSLRNELEAAKKKLIEENAANLPFGRSTNDPGPGRLDALAHIKNRIANTVYPENYLFPGNNVDATAPVSFPFLWDAPFQDFTQWPGNVSNANIGSLARNVGEVTGVFAETNVTNTFGLITASSTAKINNLVAIEDTLLKLKSPLWPSNLAPIDQMLANQGAGLFDTYCESCHVEVDRLPRTKWIPTFAIGANVVGTDPTQANNNLNDRALAGKTGSDWSASVPPNQILASALLPILAIEVWRIPGFDSSHKQSGAPSSPVQTLAAGESSGHTYKSRPLNGIWATGPFLHNGSVRTLWDLLLPAASRPSAFCVGSIELDTTNVGQKGDCSVPNAYALFTSDPGNKATGHEYGTYLTVAQRRALVEYLKTL